MNIEEVIQNKLRKIFDDESIVFDKSRFAGGLTNYNYIMNIKGIEYVIRKPGGMTDQMIDRKVEKVNNNIASKFGINSQCIYFDEHTGIKISLYIENSKNIALLDPNCNKNIKNVSEVMKKMHQSNKTFPNTFDFWAELSKYERIVNEINGALFFDYSSLKKQLYEIMTENIKSTTMVPCHNDTVPENFLLEESGRTYLIDWEYSGMNDPSWDVGSYILESQLAEDSIEHLLMTYYNEKPSVNEITKVKCYILAQDLLWTVWALIRHYHGDDFLDYCNNRYERFRKNIKAVKESIHYPIADMVIV
ncbi:choline kinase family protein [Proteinivorax tanatarense]|uniref:Choline kinase family protein n=1 Tax=Proteinivorax tanatarense TaxID=1260629 RepID=A0AAU7VM93_9FIRM